MTSYPTDCQYHRLQIVLDKVVLSRAWSSLPAHLQIFRLSESGGTGEVFQNHINCVLYSTKVSNPVGHIEKIPCG